MTTNSEAADRAREYCDSRVKTMITETFGHGTDGSLWKTDDPTVIKVFANRHNFELEKECYLRLRGVNSFVINWEESQHEFAVPRMIDSDSDLMIIEMDIVDPSYILDFGKVSLDRKRDFSPATMHDYHEFLQDQFGPYAKLVRRLISRLESRGIYYEDARLGNIMIAGYEPEM